MKYYTIVFPGEFGQHVQETWSTEQILESYWDYWCERMYKAGKDPEVHTFQDCIDDWCTIHWAEETDEFGKKITNNCYCHTCNPIDFNNPKSMYMRLCPECGNKRCPKATNHNLACTNSNEPNQEGSIY